MAHLVDEVAVLEHGRIVKRSKPSSLLMQLE
jgi:ABC-type multidrug transport system fused ATPase/permease subunit